jgi:hypothetical protein
MPTAPVDDHGTELYYEDTGALPGPYTTLICVPGIGFTAPGIFARMREHASANRLRLVFLNRRDYPGSTPLAPTDATDSTPPGNAFYERRAAEIARFAAWFARAAALPPYVVFADGSATGGVVLLGWSFGACVLLDVLASADRLEPRTRAGLAPYLRAVCTLGACFLFPSYPCAYARAPDTPHHVFGLPAPPARPFYHPLTDIHLSGIERYSTFEAWASSYYQHRVPVPPPFRSDVPGATVLNCVKAAPTKTPNSAALAVTHNITLLADARDALGEPPPTLLGMSDEERRACMWWRVLELRWDAAKLMRPFDGQLARTERVLRGAGGAEPAFPRAAFVMLYGERTLWESVYAVWKVSELHAKFAATGDAQRVFRTACLRGANHFVSLLPHFQFHLTGAHCDC